MLQAEMVWPAEPNAVYFRRGNHLFNRIECPRVTHAKPSGEIGCRFSMLAVWTVHTEHIGIAHAYPRLNMKARYESAADESYSEPLKWHQFRSLPYGFTFTASVSEML